MIITVYDLDLNLYFTTTDSILFYGIVRINNDLIENKKAFLSDFYQYIGVPVYGISKKWEYPTTRWIKIKLKKVSVAENLEIVALHAS